MKKINVSPKLLAILGLIVFAVLLRLLPHWPNFTPVASVALLGGVAIRRKELAFLLPLAVMLLSDWVIGFHSTMFAVYSSFLLIVALGMWLKGHLNVLTLFGASLLSSFLFFAITNFASWQSGMMPYTHDAQGLMQAYIAGIPFLLNGVMGDLFYNSILFGVAYYLTNRQSAIA